MMAKTENKTKNKGKAGLLSFGLGGHTIYMQPEESGTGCMYTGKISGYCNPQNFCELYHWWAHPDDQLSSNWSDLEVPPEGIPCIDVSEAVENKGGLGWVLRGPLLSLAWEGEVENPGGLDWVGPEQFIRGWKEHGARVGRAFRNEDRSGRIEWEDEKS